MAIDTLAETIRSADSPTTQLMQQTGALLYGEFTLASGKKSEYYFDSKKLTLDPQGALFVAKSIVEALDHFGIKYVGGTAYGAIPIAAQVALYSAIRPGNPIRAFYHRRTPDAKTHGTQATAEGQIPPPGEPTAILEDVVTTGESMLDAIRKAERDGFLVTHAMTLVDRNEGGRQAIESADYHFWSLYRADHSNGKVRILYDGV